jgi:hypothetical protein
MGSRSHLRRLLPLAAVGGVVGLLVAIDGSLVLGIVAGLACLAVGIGLIAWRQPREPADRARDPSRRRFLAAAGLGGFALAIGGSGLGWTMRRLGRPPAGPIQEEMARGIGAEYMELIRRGHRAGRSGDVQLLLAPFNSSNYSFESLSLARDDPRTSHASTWMYIQRIPLLVYGPGRIEPSDSVDRVTLVDLAPTTAGLIGFDAWPSGRDGRRLPGVHASASPPKVIVTFVIDGGGWNVLHQWPDSWPTLKHLMTQGANFRNAVMGSFPAVTTCAHATIGTGAFPATHGITGDNIRDGTQVRRAFGSPGQAEPSDILVPTLADLWSGATQNRAWIGEIGYQLRHLGTIGRGGPSRTGDAIPVAMYYDESVTHDWRVQNPALYRMPAEMPPPAALTAYLSAFTPPSWDPQLTPTGPARHCCAPPIVRYQGDVIDSAFASEPIGRTGVTDLLYVNFKAPDYTGHVYNMLSRWEGLVLEEVDRQLGRLVGLLDERFPGDYVLIVTADHGQCPIPDAVDGVRLDPIQLQDEIEREFGGGLGSVVQTVTTSEVYLHADRLWDNGGATADDVAAFLRDYRYRQNIGPYVPTSAIEQDRLDNRELAAAFGAAFLDRLAGTDPSRYGATTFGNADAGIPSVS